jgi:RimJ/RimL family protein N-acetyltransferase
MPILTDGVITLRPPRHDDVDAIYEACQDAEIQTWTNVPSPYTREHAIDYVERVAHLPTTAAFLAFHGDELVGSFGVMEIDRERAYAEIGYWVAAPARGRGVATRGVILARDWAAEELGAQLVELVIHEDNLPSKRVAERTGFLATGERRPAPRKEEPGPVNHDVYAWRPE